MPEQSESLKDATLTGVRWASLAKVGSESLAFVAAIVLARLVSPSEFGRAAVALIFIPLAAILTFEGFASALVQRPTFEEAHRRAAVFMGLVGGALLSALTFGLVGPVWRPLFGAETSHLIAFISPVFLIAAVGAVPRATLWRALDFRRLGLCDVSGLLAGQVVAVTLAATGMGAKAILIGGMAQVITQAVLLFACAPSPAPRWHPRAQRDIGSFGLPAAMAGLVGVLFRNVGYAILAARLSPAQTGIFWRSFNLGVIYQDKISGIMLQLSFPVYSRTTSREQLRHMHERAARVHAAIIFPLLATLVVLAPVLIPFVFGPAWEPSVRPAQILALAGMIAAILTGYPQVMLAVGKPNALLRFNIVILGVFGAAVFATATHGLIAVSIAVLVVHVVILLGVYRFLLQPHIGLSIRSLVPELGPAVVGCLGLAAVGFPLRMLVPGGDLVVIVVAGGAGFLAYALIVSRLFPAAWSDLRMLAERVVPPIARLQRRGMPAPAPSAAS
ncbi:MAG: lipopolysaccharide exporter [Solirubrobacteraceae bacterium]